MDQLEGEFAEWELCNWAMGIDQPMSKFDAIIETPDDSKGPLTFGIELEFLVPVLTGLDRLDPHPQESRPPIRRHDVCTSLDMDPEKADNDVDDQIRDELEKACDIRFRHQRDDILVEPHDNIPYYDAWRLVKEDTLAFLRGRRFTGYEEYDWLGKEITSEIMRCDDPKFYEKKIRDVCRAIRSTRVHLNGTCGVHVHVGNGFESFSLVTMKKFATLIYLLDKKLIDLHHPTRRNNICCETHYNATKLSELAAQYGRGRFRPLTADQQRQMDEFIPACTRNMPKRTSEMILIWKAKTIEEIAELMHDRTDSNYSWASVRFAKFLPAGKTGGNTHTFEFRQMTGCLDPEPIIHWVRVCTAITDFARLSTPECYKSLVDKIILNPFNFSALDLLSELRLYREARYFRSKGLAWKKGMDLGHYEGAEQGQLFLSKMK